MAAIYLAYIMLFEACWVNYLREEMGFERQCYYLTTKMLAGLTKKITLFAHAHLSYILIES